MIKTNIQVKDSGMKPFSDRMKKLHGSVDIGVFGEKDTEQVIIAAANEFGTDKAGRGHRTKIPQRSFLRSTLDEEKDDVRQKIDSAKVQVVTGKLSKKKFLSRLGLWFESKVREKILAGGTPYIENAESTKADKIARGREFPAPLNDEGRLRQSIISRVNE